MGALNDYPVVSLVFGLVFFIWPSVATVHFPLNRPYEYHRSYQRTPQNMNLYTYQHARDEEQTSKLQEMFSWNELDFEFPDEHTRYISINTGIFIPGASIPTDIDVHYHGRNYF